MKLKLLILFLLAFAFSHAQLSFFKSQSLDNLSEEVVFFDKDNDGDLDCYFVRNFEGSVLNTSTNTIWENNGSGTFTNLGNITGNDKSMAAISFDYNNDNSIDLFTLNKDSDSYLQSNNGNGTFTIAQYLSPLAYTSIDHADIDNDGDLDVLIGAIGTTINFVMIYTFNGTSYINTNIIPLSNSNDDIINAMEMVDIDNDSDSDLLLSQNGNNKIFKNDGNGNFAFHQNTEITGTLDIKTADLDNDGDFDIFFAASGPNTIWLNDGLGNFSNSGQSIGTNDTNAIGIIDINNDGYLDVVCANSGPNRIYMNTQTNAIFNDSGWSLGNENTKYVAVGDVDNDSRNDFLFANWDTNALESSELWLNTSTLSVDTFNNSNLKLFPNPTTDSFTLQNSAAVSSITIYDLQGKLVKTFLKPLNSYNISDLHSGIYVVKIKNSRGEITKKLIKQ